MPKKATHIALLLLIIMLLHHNLGAQYAIDWASQPGGDQDDHAHAAMADSDGRIVIAGKVVKKKTHTWVLVTDHEGREIWGKTYRDSHASGAEGIIETSDGNYMLVGSIIKRKRDRNPDGYLMKIDKTGRVLWQKRYGGKEEDVLTDVCETADGGFMATGYSMSNIDLEKEFWVLSTDKFGNKKHETFFYDSDDDAGNAIIPSGDGNFIAAGYTLFTGKRTSRILKIDQDCEVIWDMPLETEYTTEIHDLLELPDSSYMAIGTRKNEHFKNEIDYDAFTLRFTTDGDTIASREYYEPGWQEATSACRTFDGNMALAGFVKSESREFSDFWVKKIDITGDILYEDTYRRKTIDFPDAVFEMSDNGVVLVGSTWHIERGWDYAILKYKDINKTQAEFMQPGKPISTSAKAAADLKICVTSFMPPARVDITVNGIIQIPDAYSALTMSENNCMYPIVGQVQLSPGMNRVMVAVKDQRGNVVSEESVIHYIPPTDMSW